MKEVWTWIRHNQGVTAALVTLAVLIVWTFGCEPKVDSLIEPDKKVNAAELSIEIESETTRLMAELEELAKRGELKMEELAKMEVIRKELVNFASISAASGGFNPSGLVTMAFSILGFGAVVDNRLKDKVIKNRPLEKKASLANEV